MSWPILTVGPRELPACGVTRVWLDTGSGPGYLKEVRCDQLTLADADDGDGSSAIYLLHPADEATHQ